MKYTFLLPAYKVLYFREALSSILAQTYTDFTVIVSDDCSPEDIKSIVGEFQDERISYRRNRINIGGKNLVKHWNMLVDMADSEYLIIASDDDIYAPTFLEEIDKLSLKYPEIQLIKARARIIDAQGETTKEEHLYDEKISQLNFIADYYYTNHITCIANFVFKTSILQKKGGFVDYPLAWASDVITTALLAVNGVAVTHDILFEFRMSNINISSGSCRNIAIERQKLNASLMFDADIMSLLKEIKYEKNKLNNNIYNELLISHKDYIMHTLICSSYLFSFTELLPIIRRYRSCFKNRYYLFLFYKKWFYASFFKHRSMVPTLNTSNILFMSFADSKYTPMLKRIKAEALNSHFFSEVRIFSEKDFEKDYKRKYKERFKQRGFGYWMWKSYMVRRMLKEMQDNDILVYSDSGCTINANAKKRFEDYISYVRQVQSGILVFAQMELLESAYTKADMFAYAECLNDSSITSTPQFWGGTFIIRKCQQSVEFVEKWYDLSHNHFSLITDEPSKVNNFPNFIENRHDQSALSVLVKPYKPYIIDDRETYTTGSFHEELALFPFWATRNRKCSWIYLRKDGLRKRFHNFFSIFK